ncbi:MAG: hypothetical protein ABEL76_17000 [Bradymonadaceae bacterium]
MVESTIADIADTLRRAVWGRPASDRHPLEIGALEPPAADAPSIHVPLGRPPPRRARGLVLHDALLPREIEDVVARTAVTEADVAAWTVWGLERAPWPVDRRARWLLRLAHRAAGTPVRAAIDERHLAERLRAEVDRARRRRREPAPGGAPLADRVG